MNTKKITIILLIFWIIPSVYSIIYLKSFLTEENSPQGSNVFWKYQYNENNLDQIKSFEKSFIRGFTSKTNQITYMTYNPNTSNGNFSLTDLNLDSLQTETTTHIGSFMENQNYILLDGLIHVNNKEFASIWKEGISYRAETNYIVYFNSTQIINKTKTESDYPYLAPHAISVYKNNTILMVLSLSSNKVTSDFGEYLGIFSPNGTLMDLIHLEQEIKSITYDSFNDRIISISGDLQHLQIRNDNWTVIKELEVNIPMYEIDIYSSDIILIKSYRSPNLFNVFRSILILLIPIAIFVYYQERKTKTQSPSDDL